MNISNLIKFLWLCKRMPFCDIREALPGHSFLRATRSAKFAVSSPFGKHGVKAPFVNSITRLRLMAFCTLLAGITISCNSSREKEIKIFSAATGSWSSKIKHRFIKDITYRAVEVPGMYYVIKSTGLKNPASIDSVYQTVKGERVVEFEFEHARGKDLLEPEYTGRSYTSSVKYMAFTIANDFLVATSSGDTIPCIGVNLERNYKIAPFKRLLLHFKDIPPGDAIQLIYNDRLYKAGVLTFDFNDLPTEL